ncbi:protein of unknown function (plasmid) [Caballeronia sp. S22]
MPRRVRVKTRRSLIMRFMRAALPCRFGTDLVPREDRALSRRRTSDELMIALRGVRRSYASTPANRSLVRSVCCACCLTDPASAWPMASLNRIISWRGTAPRGAARRGAARSQRRKNTRTQRPKSRDDIIDAKAMSEPIVGVLEGNPIEPTFPRAFIV